MQSLYSIWNQSFGDWIQWPRQSHGNLHLQALRKTKSHLDGTIRNRHQFGGQWFLHESYHEFRFLWNLQSRQVAVLSRIVSEKPCGEGRCPLLQGPSFPAAAAAASGPSPGPALRRDPPSCARNARNTRLGSHCPPNCSLQRITECRCTPETPPNCRD